MKRYITYASMLYEYEETDLISDDEFLLYKADEVDTRIRKALEDAFKEGWCAAIVEVGEEMYEKDMDIAWNNSEALKGREDE